MDVDFSEEIQKNYILYSIYVIAGRAIPSIIDGLKPVQRRILWYMYDNKIFPKGKTVKSARISNSVIGSYHPHGDCYGSMVTMGAPYTSLPLITPQGSYGYFYGDTPAASRYTEAKLSEAGTMILADIDEGISNMIDNYDGTLKEPEYLAPRFPNYLINGTTGIAVGYAVKSPDHNPGEIMDLCIAVAKKPDRTLSVDEIMKIVPGPDFGTGGTIIGTDGIRNYIETGSGTFVIRGDAQVKELSRGRSAVHITSLPYGIDIEGFITKVKGLVNTGKLEGITDIKNLSDGRGLSIEITTKKGVNPQAMLANLYKLSPLEQTYAANMTGIDEEGVPRVLSVLEVVQSFLRVRETAIVRRSKNRLKAREKTVHDLEGLLAALIDIDKAVSIIRGAKDADAARNGLMKEFGVDEAQADYILSLQLRRLTQADQHELEDRKKKLGEEIDELNRIINDESYARKMLIEEMKETKKVISRPRKCNILGVSLTDHKEKLENTVKTVEVKNSGPVSVVLDEGGIRIAKKDEMSVSGNNDLWALFMDGKASRVDTGTVSSRPSNNVLVSGATPRSEPIVGIASVDDKVLVVDADGNVKVCDMSTLPKTAPDSDIIPEKPAPLVDVERLDPAKPYVLFITSAGKALKVDLSKIRAQGRTGNGVAGVSVGDDARLVAAYNVNDDDVVYTRTNDSEKATPVSDIPVKGRGTGGVVIHLFRKADQGVESASIGSVIEPTPRGKSGTRL